MENEKDYSLDRSVEVDKIIDFYKNIDTDTDETPKTEEHNKENKFNKITKNILNKIISQIEKTSLYKKLLKEDVSNNDNEIESHSFGLGQKSKLVLFHTATLIICIAIIALSTVLTIFLPGNKLKIDEKANELRKEENYASLESRHSSIKTEIDELIISNNEKENMLNQVTDAENSKADFRLQIEEKKHILNNLNALISQKRDQVAQIDKEIASKAPLEKTYTPGKYVVGTHIAAGKYSITGTGKFMIATSTGKSKINVTLNSTPLEVYLQETDVLKFNGKVKFTSLY